MSSHVGVETGAAAAAAAAATSVPTSSWSLDLVLFLQQASPLPWLDEGMILLTLVGDPKTLFLFLAPLLYALPSSAALGLDALLALLLADWSNAVLKWPFAGDRPFWFDARVKEFRVTCESGFGFPSGHMTAACAITYILISHTHKRWRPLARTISIPLLTLLGVTRVYLGAHFPEQVVCGSFAGLWVGWVVRRFRLRHRLTTRVQAHLHRFGSYSAGGGGNVEASARFWRAVLKDALLLSLIMLVIPVVEFNLVSLWSDPMRSLQLARDGCEATARAASAASLAAEAAAQLDRSPFMSFARDAGAALGLVVGWAAVVAYRLRPLPLAHSHAHSQPHSQSQSLLRQSDAQTEHDGKPAATLSVSAALDLSSPRTTRALLLLLLRGAIVLLSCALFRQLLAWLFASSLVSSLSLFFPPSLFVYFSNTLQFAAMTLYYLAALPTQMRGVDRTRDSA